MGCAGVGGRRTGGYGGPVDEPLPDVPARRRAAVTGALLLLTLAGCSPGPDDPSPEPAARDTSAATATPAPTPSAAPSPEPLLDEPDEGSTVGVLAEGFPTDLLPLPADAEILVSAYAPEGDPGAGAPYTVSLNVRTPLPVADVAALYRASLTAAGFTESVGAPAAGTLAAQSTYSRSGGDELLVVGVLDRDGVRTVTIGGRVRAKG